MSTSLAGTVRPPCIDWLPSSDLVQLMPANYCLLLLMIRTCCLLQNALKSRRLQIATLATDFARKKLGMLGSSVTPKQFNCIPASRACRLCSDPSLSNRTTLVKHALSKDMWRNLESIAKDSWADAKRPEQIQTAESFQSVWHYNSRQEGRRKRKRLRALSVGGTAPIFFAKL